MLPESVSISGRNYEIKYIYVDSRIAKAMMEDGKIIIKLPKRYPWHEKIKAANVLKEKVAKRLAKDPYWGRFRYPNFYDGQKIRILGTDYILHMLKSKKRSSCKIKGSEIIIKKAEGREENNENLRLIKKCFSKYMLEKVRERVEGINNEHFGFEINEVKLGYAVGRWGSCNARNKKININVLTLMMPSYVIDYVIIHELAHMKEPNHSQKFWRLVGEACADYKERAKWLRENGHKLSIDPSISLSW
ncbi:MAG: M48 family metallopeptidase [Candidatus Micrarchaeia archaeon]